MKNMYGTNSSIILQGDEGEIGWISNKKYWNHGYMSEALRALIPYAFANLRLRRLYATCAEKNTASIGVMEKCGLKRIRSESNLKADKKGVEVTYNKLTYETKA